MSWTDKKAIKTINQIKEDFDIDTFVETGTFKGINAKLQASNFNIVLTCEICDDFYNASKNRLNDLENVKIYKESSPDFLTGLKEKLKGGKTVFFYLDAHFYDPDLPKDEKFVVVKELESLKGFDNCVICVHDFDCQGLGHCCYDGQPLNFELLKKGLYGVNPNFTFYTNKKEYCDIVTEEDVKNNLVKGLEPDFDTLDNLRYAWKEERLTYRGLIYCTPKKIDISKYELIEYES